MLEHYLTLLLASQAIHYLIGAATDPVVIKMKLSLHSVYF
jgi:hypothetical protein